MKKIFTIVAAAMLFASNALFGQASLSPVGPTNPTSPTDKQAAHLQHKLLKQEGELASYVQLLQSECNLIISEKKFIDLTTQATAKTSVKKMARLETESSFLAHEQMLIEGDLQNIDYSNPAAVEHLRLDLMSYEDDVLLYTNNQSPQCFLLYTSPFLDLPSMLETLVFTDMGSELNIASTIMFQAFLKIDNINAQLIAQFCIFEYVDAVVAVQANGNTDANIATLNNLSAQLSTLDVNDPKVLLNWQSQVIHFENSLSAPATPITATLAQ